MGFAHPSNEKHIVTTGTAAGDWYACDGQDNTNVDCSTGAVPNILVGNVNGELCTSGGVPTFSEFLPKTMMVHTALSQWGAKFSGHQR
jgi:hypothetical protein